MSYSASFHHQLFHFKLPSGTSRGVLTEKHSWFIKVWETSNPDLIGIGECSVIKGLSPDFLNQETYEKKLSDVIRNLDQNLDEWPSIKFGVEMALNQLKNKESRLSFKNSFYSNEQRIPINGLIWMGEISFMRQQIEDKIAQGFSTIKLKIGAIDFDKEIQLLSEIRSKYSKKEIELRVDANGAFTNENALQRLKQLHQLEIHSIEQPIPPGDWIAMQKLCKDSPLPIALDEELIGINNRSEKIKLLETINPQFIILKPSLHGAFSGCDEWIQLAEARNIEWWITSALESNIGLEAICQFTANYHNTKPQGLGTGGLYIDNIPSNLKIKDGRIFLAKNERE